MQAVGLFNGLAVDLFVGWMCGLLVCWMDVQAIELLMDVWAVDLLD